MSKAIWISTGMRLPEDGQTVLVKTAHGRVEHLVTFRAEPEPHWESRHFITEIELYAYWRRLPTGDVPASAWSEVSTVKSTTRPSCTIDLDAAVRRAPLDERSRDEN